MSRSEMRIVGMAGEPTASPWRPAGPPADYPASHLVAVTAAADSLQCATPQVSGPGSRATRTRSDGVPTAPAASRRNLVSRLLAPQVLAVTLLEAATESAELVPQGGTLNVAGSHQL